MEEIAEIQSVEQVFGAAGLAVNGLNVNALRTNAVLRKDEWQLLDTAVVDVARQRLIGIADLQEAGLVQQLGGLGTTISQYETQSDMSTADIDMDAETAGEEDNVTYTLHSIPVPIIHKSFRINIRKLEASRRLGESLDVVQARVAARKVRDKLEDLLFNGDTSIKVNGQVLEGYTTATNKNTVTGADWGTIANIYANCLSAVAANEADNYFGPYILYVAKTQFGQMRNLYTDGAPETAYERVLRGLPQIQAIKPADALTAGTAVLVQMTADVIDLAVGLDITTVQWETRGGMSIHFKVMAAMAPRPKSDANSGSGICVISSI